MKNEASNGKGETDLEKGGSEYAWRRQRRLLWEEIMNTPDELKSLRVPGWDEMKPVGKEW